MSKDKRLPVGIGILVGLAISVLMWWGIFKILVQFVERCCR